MRAVLSFLLLVAVCLVLVDSAYGRRKPPAEGEDKEKCERAFPQRQGRRLRCKYICKGWPFRRGYEEDGTVCTKRRGVEGRCLNGRCIANKGQWTTEQPGDKPSPSPLVTPGA